VLNLRLTNLANGVEDSLTSENRKASGSRAYWLTFSAVLLFLSLPVITTTYAPLVDYPSHLARAYILSQYHHVPIYQQNYIEMRELLPNLAIDVIVPLLLHFVSLVTASKIFLLLIVVLFAIGSHVLGVSLHGHATRLTILCMFLVYNSMLLYGFVNYLFGVAMFLVTFGLWFRWRNTLSIARLVIVGLLVLCTYLSHLTACAYLGIAIFVLGIFDFRVGRWRSLLLTITLFTPELALYLIYRHHSASSASWGTFRQKIIAGLPLVLSYRYSFDLLFIAAVFCIGLYALRFVRILPAAKPVLAAGLCLLLLYLVSPHYWLGGSPVDARFVLPAAFMILLSFEIQARPTTKRVLLTLCLVIFSIRVVMIWKTWRVLSERIAGQVQMLSIIPDGANVYPAVVLSETTSSSEKTDRSFIHVAEMAAIERHAFVPSQLAIPGQEILLFRHPLPYHAPDRNSSQWIRTMLQYDFAWSFDLPADFEAMLEANGDRIDTKDGFSLWRIRKSGPGTKEY
jgi:hypothetical protein